MKSRFTNIVPRSGNAQCKTSPIEKSTDSYRTRLSSRTGPISCSEVAARAFSNASHCEVRKGGQRQVRDPSSSLTRRDILPEMGYCDYPTHLVCCWPPLPTLLYMRTHRQNAQPHWSAHHSFKTRHGQTWLARVRGALASPLSVLSRAIKTDYYFVKNLLEII